MTAWPAVPLSPENARTPTLGQWDGRVPDLETLISDPTGWARLLRSRMPLIPMELSTWILSFDAVERLLTHPGVRQFGPEVMEMRGITSGPLYDWWTSIVLTANGERHTRLRAPLQRTFSFPLIDAKRDRVRTLANDLIDGFEGQGTIDFVERFAAQLPVRTICDVLGVPWDDIPTFKAHADTLGRAFGFFTAQDVGPIDEAVVFLTDYVREIVAVRRASPRDDFLSSLVTAVDAGGAYSDEELLAQIIGLIFAGSDTTRTALSILITLLMQRPQQWDAVCADDTLIKTAVEESLRFEPTVASIPRFVVEDIEIGGHRLRANSVLVMSISAAQRDPARYANPDAYSIHRKDLGRGAIGFGGGAHRCLGEALARAELEEALAAITRRLPHMKPGGPLPHFVDLATGIRKLDRVMVTV